MDTKMHRKIPRLLALASLTAAVLGGMGCSSDQQESTKPPVPTAQAKAVMGDQKAKGGMADASSDPAPAGVRTDLKGGAQ